MTNRQRIGLFIVTYTSIWVAIFNWIKNNDIKSKMRKIMENTSEIIRWSILGLEHIALLIVGFLGGAFTFYFKSKYYMNTKLFTKEEVRGLINMALGEERQKESSLMKKMIRRLK